MNSAARTIRPDDCADALTAVRERVPLVQCLTNIVVAQWTANVLLAVGVAPAMVDNPEEARRFRGDRRRSAGQSRHAVGRDGGRDGAGGGRGERGRDPWVLDPVAAGALGWRTEIARKLLVANRRRCCAATPPR